MPQFFESAVMTNAGAALVARSLAEGITINFTAIAVGNGSYTNSEKLPSALKQRTSLKSQQVSYVPSSVIRDTESSVRISALISNVDPVSHEAIVTTGFYINEIGVFAEPSDGATGPILFSVSVTAGTQGDFMPAYTGDNPAQIVQGYVTAVSSESTITVTAPVNPYALSTDLQALSESVDSRISDILSEVDAKLTNKADLVNGRIPYSQLPESAMEYKGTWNAGTNIPTITQGIGTNGDFYIVEGEGTWESIVFANSDRIIFDGDIGQWKKLSGGQVSSVAGKTGAVTLTKSDVGLSNVDNTSDANKPVSTAMQTALNGKANSSHTHDDRYYTESEVDTKLNGKANSTHTHDDRYYTESEVDTKLNGKANSSHNHTKSQITDFPTSLPASDVYSWAKASSKPSYSWSEIGSKPTSFTPSAHNQGAATITAGTLAGQVNANATAEANVETAQIRDIYAGTADLTAGSSNLTTGAIYLVYE